MFGQKHNLDLFQIKLFVCDKIDETIDWVYKRSL